MRSIPLPLVGGAYADETRPWSQQDTVNYLPCVAEKGGTRSQDMLKTPPGLYPYLEIPDSRPVRGTYEAEGKFFAVIGKTLYQISNSGIAIALGTVPGLGRVMFTHNQISNGNEIVVVNGSAGYVYNTVTEVFERITDPGFPGSATVSFIDSYVLGIDPQGRYAFNSKPANATDYNTLDRFTSEVSPDPLVGHAVSNNELLLLSTTSAEFFENSGASVQPFRTKRITMDKGCAGAYCIVEIDNTICWLGGDGVFYKLDGYTPRRISTRPIEQAIRGLNWTQCFAFPWEDAGHAVAYWTFPDGKTWGWDASNGEWHRRESLGLNRWRANSMSRWRNQWYAGDFQAGRIWRMDWDYVLEGDQEFVSERTCAVMHDNQNGVQMPRLELVMDTGRDLTEPAQFPVQPVGPQISGDAPGAQIDEPYPGFTYTVTPGDAAIVSVELHIGTLPSGLTLTNDGEITGTPTALGSSTFTVRATDASGLFADVEDTIEVADYDPFFGDVIALLHGAGPNGSGVIVDVIGNTWIQADPLTPDVKVDTSIKKFGTGSLYIDPVTFLGDAQTGPKPLWADSTDFCVEVWVRLETLDDCVFLRQRSSGTFDRGICLKDSHFAVRKGSITAALLIEGATVASIDEFVHIAYVRLSDVCHLYVNGVSAGSENDFSGIANETALLEIGDGNGGSFTGHLEDYRVTVGAARYTANFTPPSRQFPDEGPPP